MQFERTRRAFDRWSGKNLYLEARIIREGNLAFRDLLLAKGHLIPPHLMADAALLVEHYDRWLEEFENKRTEQNPANEDAFVFVGPAGYPFPREAENHFRQEFQQLQGNSMRSNPCVNRTARRMLSWVLSGLCGLAASCAHRSVSVAEGCPLQVLGNI